ncbi:PRC-barrel domain containing protein [Cryobacterium sp. MDB1-18-2]|uniref:PRC-barrel domain-containing protein n=1 Tax=unclassified Cryobacterium TaxID=2649013 RepID=UPI00106D3CA0|nr:MULTISPECIES: PRC-barrel domain-containing protein [unclassified Cryobacterium]TFC22850.1 PRC-barrel domain containing protein [Cryobacterium sp. MDB1-18-2]TFC42706.1 PRC-barrel domain containing protein [Cryobacterium sp. MDB1-18-1]
MITLEGIDDIVVNGGFVVTSDGAKLGSVEQVFLSKDSGEPAFVTVRTGLFGMLESFVPLAGATIDGPRVVVAFDRDRIRNGPRIESDRGSITADEENELYGYYGTSAPESPVSPESSVSVEPTEMAADATGAPARQVQSPGAPPTPDHPHPHPLDGPHPPPPHAPNGPHDGAPPPPPHLLKHEAAGRPHPHDGPPPPPHSHPHPRDAGPVTRP